jgi:uncharacterized protein YxjI
MNEALKEIAETTKKTLQGDKQMKIDIARLRVYEREGNCIGKDCLAQGKSRHNQPNRHFSEGEL